MHQKNYIDIAQKRAEKEALNSTITQRHGCAAVCIRGKNKGQIVACGFNRPSYSLSRGLQRESKWFERETSSEKCITKRVFISCRNVSSLPIK